MLRADSDEDGVVDPARKRHKTDAVDNSAELAQLKAYFFPPVHRKDDVSLFFFLVN